MTDDLPPASQPVPPGAPWEQPKEPNAVAAMIVGIVGLVGGVMCYLPLLCGPVAIVLGYRSLQAIKLQPWLGGRSEAVTGFVLGIVATAFLALLAVVIGIIAVLAIFYPEVLEEA